MGSLKAEIHSAFLVEQSTEIAHSAGVVRGIIFPCVAVEVKQRQAGCRESGGKFGGRLRERGDYFGLGKLGTITFHSSISKPLRCSGRVEFP